MAPGSIAGWALYRGDAVAAAGGADFSKNRRTKTAQIHSIYYITFPAGLSRGLGMFLENFLFPCGKAADFIGTLSRRPILLTRSRRNSRAAGTRMRQHPAPSRAALAILAVRLVIRTCPDCPRAFFRIGGKKDAVSMAFTHVFWITADRDYCSNFARCKSISPNWLGRTIL